MPNIVYALTNAAMPGIVKIGMTDRDDVRRRMSDLYTTGVPLPFDCVVAREIDGREALENRKRPSHCLRTQQGELLPGVFSDRSRAGPSPPQGDARPGRDPQDP